MRQCSAAPILADQVSRRHNGRCTTGCLAAPYDLVKGFPAAGGPRETLDGNGREMVDKRSERAADFFEQLPQTAQRKLTLEWDDLVEQHGFTGNHLTWHQSPRRIMGPKKITETPPPPIDIRSREIHHERHYITPPSYEDLLKERQSNPAVIDAIGIKETTALAEARFSGIVRECFSWWSMSSSKDSVEFARALEQFRQFVVDEVRQLWIKDRWHADWFDRACRKAVEDRLTQREQSEVTRARRLEMQHLDAETQRASQYIPGGIVGPEKHLAKVQRSRTVLPLKETLKGTGTRTDLVTQLMRKKGFKHKQFAIDADVTADQWRDWRRGRAHKDGAAVDLRIREAARQWLER